MCAVYASLNVTFLVFEFYTHGDWYRNERFWLSRAHFFGWADGDLMWLHKRSSVCKIWNNMRTKRNLSFIDCTHCVVMEWAAINNKNKPLMGRAHTQTHKSWKESLDCTPYHTFISVELSCYILAHAKVSSSSPLAVQFRKPRETEQSSVQFNINRTIACILTSIFRFQKTDYFCHSFILLVALEALTVWWTYRILKARPRKGNRAKNNSTSTASSNFIVILLNIEIKTYINMWHNRTAHNLQWREWIWRWLWKMSFSFSVASIATLDRLTHTQRQPSWVIDECGETGMPIP